MKKTILKTKMLFSKALIKIYKKSILIFKKEISKNFFL